MGSVLYELAALRRLYLRVRWRGVRCPHCTCEDPTMFERENATVVFCNNCSKLFVYTAPKEADARQVSAA
jgi:ribosomal protein S27E